MTLRREVGARLEFVVADPAAFAVVLAVAEGVPVETEHFRATIDGEELEERWLRDTQGTRLALIDVPAGVLRLDYTARVVARAVPARGTPLDPVLYLRPSRYVQSDTLTPFARETFSGREGTALVRTIEEWVHEHLQYRSDATSPLGGAVETLAHGAGVCRDYAHLTIALLRALDIPARYVSVYAPQLQPMDLHAVVEAYVEGRWQVIDATRLAPRTGMVRVATGRDAADTAFVTNTLADAELVSMSITATADENLSDDARDVVELS